MSNRVDYPGRTSCGCPYLNQPDPERHWKDCHYRLNAQQAEPARAQDERDSFKPYRLAGEFCVSRGIDDDSEIRPKILDAFCSGYACADRPAQTEQQPEQSGLVDSERAEAAFNAVISYMLGEGRWEEPIEFLRCWNEGDFDALREEWPEAPLAIYYADSLADYAAIDAVLSAQGDKP